MQRDENIQEGRSVEEPLKIVYVADTTALIDLWERYPPAIFANVWSHLSALVDEGRFLLHEEVIEELEHALDEITPWLKNHASARVAIDAAQQAALRRVLDEFPLLIDRSKRNDADPWLIATALSRGENYRQSFFPMDIAVLVHERRNQVKHGDTIGKPKVPNVCDWFKIRCVHITELFAIENWHF